MIKSVFSPACPAVSVVTSFLVNVLNIPEYGHGGSQGIRQISHRKYIWDDTCEGNSCQLQNRPAVNTGVAPPP